GLCYSGCQCGAQTLTERCDLVGAALGRARPLAHPLAPIGCWRAGVTREEMQVQVREMVAIEEDVDMIRPGAVLQRTAQTRDEQTNGLRLGGGQFGEAGDVALGLDADVAKKGWLLVVIDVVGIHQLVVIDGATDNRAYMLGTDWTRLHVVLLCSLHT